jgi:Glucose-6-phosphate dehydrogenase subunit N-terminal domain
VSTASLDTWTGEDTSVGEIERQIGALRAASGTGEGPQLRTSVLTHLAWVPMEWEQAATDTLAGLAERHPSRAILLLPDPDAGEDAIDASVGLRCFVHGGADRLVCSEVLELRLRGSRAIAPASIVTPLLLPDLPVFLRWRGRPDFDDPAFNGLIDAVDRLIIDTTEWPDLPGAYAQLATIFDRTAVSDIAWSRGNRWRIMLAGMWPGIADAKRLHVVGPYAVAVLLAAWLTARLGHRVELDHEDAELTQRIEVDGEPVEPPRGDRPSGSDLLSEELEQYARDRIYEEAVRAA